MSNSVSPEYEKFRIGKLKLKNEKTRNKKSKHKSKNDEYKNLKEDHDSVQHGNWSIVRNTSDISGPVAIEFHRHTYLRALDNGLFTLGAPHKEGTGPSPEEILVAVRINDNKVAFKSGYDKYLKVVDGVVVGISDAIGPTEQWETVVQEENMMIMAYNDCFMSIIDDGKSVIAKTKEAGPDKIFQIRSPISKNVIPVQNIKEEDQQGDLKQIEVNYVKKFQKFQNKKIKLCTEDTKNLKKAKEQGTFHEALLDRRSKMKADRYCK